AASGSVLAAAAVVAAHGYLQRNHNYIEVAVYVATLGLQRIATVIAPEANLVVYGHWWAVVIGLMALWRSAADADMVRLKIALGIVTASTGVYALAEGGLYSLVFLIEHLVLV